MAPCYKWLLKISCQAPSFSATSCSSSFIWAQSRSKLELQTYNQQMLWTSRAAEGDSNPMIPKEELALWNAFLHVPTDTRNLTRTAKLITFPLLRSNTCPARTNKDILVAANINQSPASATQLKCCISVSAQSPADPAATLLTHIQFQQPLNGSSDPNFVSLYLVVSSTMPTQCSALGDICNTSTNFFIQVFITHMGLTLLKGEVGWISFPPGCRNTQILSDLLGLFQNKQMKPVGWAGMEIYSCRV